MLFAKRKGLRKRIIMPFPLAPRRLYVSLSLLPLLIFSGCQERTPPSADRASAPKSVRTSKVSAPTEAYVYVDEAMLAKPYAIIGGTVRNNGLKRLENLSVEIELRRREDGSVERREVTVEPADLAPGQQGKYALKVLSEEWGGSRVVTLRSGPGRREVAFNHLPGAKRPPEKAPAMREAAGAPRQRSRPNGDEFINTPDNPIRVP
jgi:hypothetical protein